MLVSFSANNNKFSYASNGETALAGLAKEACDHAGVTVDTIDTEFSYEKATCKINLAEDASDELKKRVSHSFASVVNDISSSGYKGFEDASVVSSDTNRRSDLDLTIT